MTQILDRQAHLGAQIDRFILDHIAGLHFTRAEDLPESPTEWVLGKFHGGMDAGYLIATVFGLGYRGATPADCARYATDPGVELPFLGAERAVFDATIASMRERGIEAMEIAQVIELMGLALSAMHQIAGLSTEGARHG